MGFTEISPNEITGNFIDRIATDWMLVGAGTPDKFNAMTASWGQIGNLWATPVATIYVRPQRYTRLFVEGNDYFSISFFRPGKYREPLNIMGTKSGRDGDKIKEAGLKISGFGEHDIAAFSDAEVILICRKLYKQELDESCFLDKKIVDTMYPAKDFHCTFTGKIEKAYYKK